MRTLALTLMLCLSGAFADTVLRLNVGPQKKADSHGENTEKKKPRPEAPTERAPYLGEAGGDVEMEVICDGKVCRQVPKGTGGKKSGLISLGDFDGSTGGLRAVTEPAATKPPAIVTPPPQQIPLFGARIGGGEAAQPQPTILQPQGVQTLLQQAAASGIRFSDAEIRLLQRLQQDQLAGRVNMLDLGSLATCPPCRAFRPTFEGMSRNFSPDRVRFDRLDVNDMPGLARFFKVGGIPNITAIKGNTIIAVGEGNRSANQFQREVNSLLQ